MARVSTLLTAIGRATWRDLRSLTSISGNNFFYFLLFVALQPESAAFFLLILGFLLLFPLSASPFEKVPTDRWLVWPLTRTERIGVQVGCLALSPITWVTVFLLVRAGWRTGALFLAASIGARLLTWAASGWSKHMPRWDALGKIPAFSGRVGQIARIQLREMLSTIDPYVALLLALSAAAYRLFDRTADPAAFRVMALVIVIALSTSAQVLFGLDGTGIDRFRLMPLRGRELLFGKGIAFLMLAVLFTLPLDPRGGLTGALIALAVGHHVSVRTPIPQTRWRFTSGAVSFGLFQMVAISSITALSWQFPARVFVGAVLVYAGSVLIYGRVWDRAIAD